MTDSSDAPAPAAPPTARPDQRGSRRVIVGTVTSSNMDKTATVTVIRRVRDRRFHKFLTRRMKYHVHDEHNTAKVGDVVEIIESRPISKTKRWRLLSTLQRAVEPDPHTPHGHAPDAGAHADHPPGETGQAGQAGEPGGK
jgi:small subunit ribosomal protein S17